MQESKFYQYLQEKVARETTIEHISVVLKTKFSKELVDALTPALQDIDDLERLKDLYIQAIHAQSLQAFAQKLI